jgi:hypothetical protein
MINHIHDGVCARSGKEKDYFDDAYYEEHNNINDHQPEESLSPDEIHFDFVSQFHPLSKNVPGLFCSSI